MWATILGLLGKLLGSLFAKKGPTEVELAASNAASQTQLVQEQAANELISEAARDRIAADAAVVRIVAQAASEPATDADAIRADLKARFPDLFRD